MTNLEFYGENCGTLASITGLTSALRGESRMSAASRTRPYARLGRLRRGSPRKATGMGALANLLDIEGRVLRKADGLATRGLALLDRGRKYRAHRAITRAYGAIEHGRSRISRRPTDAAAVYGKIARGYHGLSNPTSAWQPAQDALAFDARNPDALDVQGLLQLARGEAKDALSSFDRALKAAPQVAPLWAFRGDAAAAAGKKDEAIASYHKVAALAPDNTENYDKLLRLTPQDAERWIRKAEAHARQEQADDALHAFDRALRLAPDRVEAWAGKASVHESSKQYDRALRCLEKAISIDDLNAGLWYRRAQVLEKAGAREDALKSYDASLERNPEDVRTWGSRGELLIAIGHPEDAVHSFDGALKLDPRNVAVLDGKRRGLLEMNKSDGLQRRSEQTRQMEPSPPTTFFTGPEAPDAPWRAGEAGRARRAQGLAAACSDVRVDPCRRSPRRRDVAGERAGPRGPRAARRRPRRVRQRGASGAEGPRGVAAPRRRPLQARTVSGRPPFLRGRDRDRTHVRGAVVRTGPLPPPAEAAWRGRGGVRPRDPPQLHGPARVVWEGARPRLPPADRGGGDLLRPRPR